MSKMMAVLGDNNEVLNIILCDDLVEETPSLLSFTESNPACVGGDYVDGYFYAPQPYPSWYREQGLWIPPKPMPDSLGRWEWDEEAQEWQD